MIITSGQRSPSGTARRSPSGTWAGGLLPPDPRLDLTDPRYMQSEGTIDRGHADTGYRLAKMAPTELFAAAAAAVREMYPSDWPRLSRVIST